MVMERELTPMEVRILGCLVEKEATTPDQYPLTVNALRNACNQKSNRFPVVDYEEGEIGHALRELEALGLTRQTWSARTRRWEHRLGNVLDLRGQAIAVLATLMLRGPQTAAEIRSHCQRIHAFDDVDDVEYVLGRLTEREPPLVRELPRQPGQRGQRYVHLLEGEPDLSALPQQSPPAATSRSKLEERIAALEEEVARLAEAVETLQAK